MTDTKREPIEVWLSQANIEVTCMIVNEDETTKTLQVDTLSMRGAQREITGYLIGQGYKPDGRWETVQMDSGDARETMRRFRPPSDVATGTPE